MPDNFHSALISLQSRPTVARALIEERRRGDFYVRLAAKYAARAWAPRRPGDEKFIAYLLAALSETRLRAASAERKAARYAIALLFFSGLAAIAIEAAALFIVL